MNPRRWKCGKFLAHFSTPRGDRDGPGLADASFSVIFEAKITIFDAKTTIFTLPTSFASFSVTVWSYELIFKLVTNVIRFFSFPKTVLTGENSVEKMGFEKESGRKKGFRTLIF